MKRILHVKSQLNPLSCFSGTPTCDEQTHRQTETPGHSMYRASIASRSKSDVITSYYVVQYFHSFVYRITPRMFAYICNAYQITFGHSNGITSIFHLELSYVQMSIDVARGYLAALTACNAILRTTGDAAIERCIVAEEQIAFYRIKMRSADKNRCSSCCWGYVRPTRLWLRKVWRLLEIETCRTRLYLLFYSLWPKSRPSWASRSICCSLSETAEFLIIFT